MLLINGQRAKKNGSDKPTIHLRLTPRFDSDGVCSLSVCLTVQSPEVAGDQPMFLFDTFVDNVPCHPYKEDDIKATDDQGPLSLLFHDIPSLNRNTQQEWRVTRPTSGDVCLKFEAYPRKVSAKTPLGARIDLRRDQGGLQGVGRWFLPILISEQTYINVVEWDLPEDAPASTRCIWSLGEGPKPILRVGRSDTICRTVYMVGPVQSYPETIPEKQTDFSACYWFGNLLPNLDRQKGVNTELYPKMANHFGVTGESYRVFIRKSEVGFGGTGFLGSYVMEYDNQTREESDDSLLLFFTHEMVHSFTDLSHEESGYDNDWFREGIAELYSTYLPYRFGMRGKDFLVTSINSHLQGYFCSPRIGMDIRDAMSEVFSDWYAEWIAYKRGCAYLLFTDCSLRQQDNDLDISRNSRFDEIVIELSHRWRVGKTVRAQDWLSILEESLVPAKFPIEDHFQRMIEGKEVLDFSGFSFLTPSMHFERVELPILEFGFDKCSRRTRVISGVVPGSHAESAGLKNDMQLVSASRPANCVEDVTLVYRIGVKEDGHVRNIEFLPRKDEKAPAWQV